MRSAAPVRQVTVIHNAYSVEKSKPPSLRTVAQPEPVAPAPEELEPEAEPTAVVPEPEKHEKVPTAEEQLEERRRRQRELVAQLGHRRASGTSERAPLFGPEDFGLR